MPYCIHCMPLCNKISSRLIKLEYAQEFATSNLLSAKTKKTISQKSYPTRRAPITLARSHAGKRARRNKEIEAAGEKGATRSQRRIAERGISLIGHARSYDDADAPGMAKKSISRGSATFLWCFFFSRLSRRLCWNNEHRAAFDTSAVKTGAWLGFFFSRV